MAISCEPIDLVTAAKCYCFSPRLQDAVEIYLLATWAGCGENVLLGNPDEGWTFGDPSAGWSFGY